MACSGGAFDELTEAQAKELIEKVVRSEDSWTATRDSKGSQKWKDLEFYSMVNDLSKKMENMSTISRTLQVQVQDACEVCGGVGHG